MVAMRHTCLHLYGPDFQWGEVETAGMLDPLIFTQLARLNNITVDGQQHRLFHDHYIVELDRQLNLYPDRLKVMPGVIALLRELRRREFRDGEGDLVLGMLTGNYAKAAPIKLRQAGIDVSWFTVAAFGDDGPTREALMGVALERFKGVTGVEADPARVIVVGDTPRDVACAHAHQCVAFAVATGSHSVSQLRAAGANFVAEDLADPADLLALLDR